jgi:hypothetical protein
MPKARASTYQVLDVPSRTQYVKINHPPTGFRHFPRVDDGISVGGLFPEKAVMDHAYNSKGKKLDDFVYNTLGWLIVSEKVKAVLAQEPKGFEFYPLGFRDRKKVLSKETYFLAQVLGLADCVDLERSVYTRSAHKPEQFLFLDKLVLDEKRIPKKAVLFRVKEMPTTYVIRADLVERLQVAGVTGFTLLELGAPVSL